MSENLLTAFLWLTYVAALAIATGPGSPEMDRAAAIRLEAAQQDRHD